MMKKNISLLLVLTMVLSLTGIKVCAESFTLDRSKILTASDLPTYTTVDFSGKTDVMKFENTSVVATKGIRYGGLAMDSYESSINKTLLVDCYLEDAETSMFSLNVVFRSVGDGNTWISGQPVSKQSSSEYSSNQWVTVEIDCREPLNFLMTNNYVLNQLQVNIPSTTGNFYVGDVRFTSDAVSNSGASESAVKTYILEKNKTIAADDLPLKEIVDFGGKDNVMKFEKTSQSQTSAIRYDNLNVSKSTVGAIGYLLVDCYLEDEEKKDFGLTAVFRQTTAGKWINSEPTSTQASVLYPANRWVTVEIECDEPLKYLADNSYTLKQLQIGIPNTNGNFYVGEAKFVGSANVVSGISLYDGDSVCEWKNGNLSVKVSFSSDFISQEMTAYAIRYEKQDEKLVAADIQQVSQTVNGGEAIWIPVTVENADSSYMSVIVVNANNRALCKGVTFGNKSDAETVSKADGGDGFYADEPVFEGKNIRISGKDNSSFYATVTLIIKNDSEVLFAAQKKVDDNNGFVFEFNGKNSFTNGVKGTPFGIYTAYISSDRAEDVLSKSIGIPNETSYAAAIDTINAGDKNEIVKILSNNQDNSDIFLKYLSLSDADLYIKEIEDNNIADTVAETLIAGKPDGGYTKENISAIFNRAVTEAIFSSATADAKYDIIKNERYSTALGAEKVRMSKAFAMLAQNEKKSTVFEGLSVSSVDFSDQLRKNVIVLAINSAENAIQIGDIITESTDVIPVDLSGANGSLTQNQLKSLYDKMLSVKSYQNYSDIAAKFTSAYEEVKSSADSSSSGGGGSSGGGSSGGSGGGGSMFGVGGSFAAPVTGTTSGSMQAIGQSKFKDVETLTWGRTEINALTKLGVISGISEDEFAPDDAITREQFCRLIAQAYKLEGTAEVPFGDFDDGAWYAESIKALYANNIISGISETSFGIGNRITRQDAAVILYRVISEKLSGGYARKDFSDADSIAEYAKSAVTAMASVGIINGYDDNTFGAKREITRREAAIVLYRALELGR